MVESNIGDALAVAFVDEADAPTVVSVDDLQPYAYGGQMHPDPWQNSLFDGGKFAGGFGPTQLFDVDYWTLRQRSEQLFTENLYARGLIRRLVTNEINTGLTPECAPDEDIIGLPEDALSEWTEDVENRFGIWAKNPMLCDWLHRDTFGAIQRNKRAAALVSGDVLVVLRHNPVTRLPMVQLVNGSAVQTPLGGIGGQVRRGHEILHGVEFDRQGRVAGHWITQDDGSSKRVPARGERSGRLISWLVYGTDKLLDDVRGQPMLSLVMQSMKEIDRYRDSAQRKAVVNSILAMFIAKGDDKMGTLPVTGGVKRKGAELASDTAGRRTFDTAHQHPGIIMQELQTGETPHAFQGHTDIDFGAFEASIINAVAWANEMPPEILTLAFQNNYSASQAAINEFKIYLNKVWSQEGEQFCSPIMVDWLISEVLIGKIEAAGFLDAWRDPRKYDIFGAWTATDWYGSIKPSTDMVKQAKGSKLLVDECWSTNAREARVTTGTKFSKNAKRVERENKLKVKAARPLAEFRAEFGSEEADQALALAASDDRIVSLVEGVISDAEDN